MVQDLLNFLRPLTPLRPRAVDKYPQRSPSPAKKMFSIRPTTSGSLNILCRIPSPLKRRPKSTVEPIRGDVSQLASMASDKPVSSNSDRPTEREAVSPKANLDCGQSYSTEVMRTRRSENYHIAHLRSLSSTRTGHWIKVCKIALSPNELKSFHQLHRAQQGPVKKADVLIHCSSIARTQRQDAGHRPLKLADERYGQAARRELWDIDPFSGEVWSVKWVSEASVASQLLSDRGKHDWKTIDRATKPSIRAVDSRGLESLRVVQNAAISTIRIVR